MAPDPLPLDEDARLAALYADDVLDSPAEPSFDRVARLAAALIGGEATACVVMVDRDRLWAKARINFNLAQAPREGSLISATLHRPGVFWLSDIRCEPEFAQSEAATDFNVRFYAGVAVTGRDEQPIGVLAVWTDAPRVFDAAVAAQLADLAGVVANELELRRGRAALQRALDERRAAEQMAEAYISHAPVALAMLDTQMRYMRVSPRWAQDYRLPETDFTGRSHYDMIPDAEKLRPLHLRALAGSAVASESPIARPDGTVRYSRFEMSPWRDAAGAIGGIVIVSIDLTDMLLAKQEAERWRERLNLALYLSDTVVWERCDIERQVYASGPAHRLFDRAPGYDDLAGDIAFGVHPDDHAQVANAWRRYIDTGAPYDEEHRYRRADGTELWVRSQAEARYDGEGRLARVVGVLRDVTEQKRVQTELARATEAAEAASRAKSAFLANMSHELRTPLNGVVGVTSALARTSLSREQVEMVTLVQDSAATLEHLLSDVLDLTRVESGRMDLDLQPVDLPDLVRGVATLFQWRAREKGVDFRVEVDEAAIGAFHADPVRLRQVLTNLVSNAVKFTHAGEIVLSLRMDGQARVVVQVADTGIGFDETTRRKLFRRFEQADGSITRRFGGTGLGLAIARALSRLMGGELEAESVPGCGSTFSLRLPLRRCDAVPASPRPVAPPAAQGLHVLLAEDHPVNRAVVSLILKSAGVTLTEVENGLQAVEAFAPGRFDLVLMDVQMPVMDGLTAIRRIRDCERAAKAAPVPVVALTANALPEHVRASSEAGADAHLCKPVTAERLLAEVARRIPAPLALAG